MAYQQSDRCSKCGAQVDFVFCPVKGRSIPLDPTNVPRAGDLLANYATYPDPRTGALVVRKLDRGEHLAPEDELVRPHWRTCPARVFPHAES